MAGESINDPLEIIDDPSDLIRETAQQRRSKERDIASSGAFPAEDSQASPGSSRREATAESSFEIVTAKPDAEPQRPRVLPPGFAAKRNGVSGSHGSRASPHGFAGEQSSGAVVSNGQQETVRAQNGRVWNPPPRPWEREARAKAAQAVATLQQASGESLPLVGGTGARLPSRFLAAGSDRSTRQQGDAIDLTNDDGSDEDDEPRIVSVKKGEIEFDEQKNNGPVCVGIVPAIVLCMYGLPDPIASTSPAVQDASQDQDPLWARANWPGASRWFTQPGFRPVVAKVKYPNPGQSQQHQRAAGEWSYGGNRPPQQQRKAEIAVSVVLSPRAHAERQLREGVPADRIANVPFYTAPFGSLSDKFVEALEPLFSRGLIHAESRCRMVPPGRATHFLHSIEILLFCTRPNVTLVSEQLSKFGITLEPPQLEQFSSSDYQGQPPLVLPHGNGSAARDAANRSRFTSSMFTAGLGGGRLVQSKEMTEEERKKQIEMVYDQLVAGEELPLAEPSPLIKTKLFPHQLQAISFLLDREKARSFDEAQDTAKSKSKDDVTSTEAAVSLWKVVRSRVDGSIRTYHNVVTQQQQSEEPEICRGAILADDMGLGKTITVIATIAATLDEAREFQRGKINRKRIAASSGSTETTDPTVDDIASGLQAGSSKRVKPNTSTTRLSQKPHGKVQQKARNAETIRLQNLVTKTKATLIVCPLTIVSNWEEQIKEHWTGGRQPSIYIYHGPSRSSSPHLLAGYDIVMTTYATLASEFANQHTWTVGGEDDNVQSDDDGSDDDIEMYDGNGEVIGTKKKSKKKRKRHVGKEAPNTLQKIEWFRIVLDEAHTIKEARTMQCKAVCNLSAQRRLSLTGTPVQNRLDDLYAQVRFLRLYPFTERAVWNEHCAQRRPKNSITSRSNANPNNEPLEQVALVKVQTIMKFLTLRRTKDGKTSDGRALLELPPKASHLVTLQFDEREQAAYKQLHQKYKEDFEEMQAAGSVGTNYATILQEILVLRMSCDDTTLVDSSKDMKRLREGNTDITKAIKEDGLTRERAAHLFNIFSESAMAECANCSTDLAGLTEDAGGGGPANDEADEASKVRPVITRCQHFLCSTCFTRSAGPKYLKPKSLKAKDTALCPACNIELSLLMDVVKLEPADVANVRSARQSPSTDDQNDDDFDYGDSDGEEQKDKQLNGKKRSSLNRFGCDRDIPVEDRTGLSTKIRFLLADLLPFSMCNRKSLLYDAEQPQLIHWVPTEEEKAQAGYTDSVCISTSDEPAKSYRPVKSVLFSQWTSMLDHVSTALHRAGIRAVRLDGKMKRNERAAALEAFKNDDGVEVFLISLRAGGFGLNLVNACRAYNIEPAWNPAVEAQAMDRIHRMGQTRPVIVKKLVIKNSIEERMLDVQRRKQELANRVGEKRGTQPSKADEKAERHKDLSILLSGDGSADSGATAQA